MKLMFYLIVAVAIVSPFCRVQAGDGIVNVIKGADAGSRAAEGAKSPIEAFLRGAAAGAASGQKSAEAKNSDQGGQRLYLVDPADKNSVVATYNACVLNGSMYYSVDTSRGNCRSILDSPAPSVPSQLPEAVKQEVIPT